MWRIDSTLCHVDVDEDGRTLCDLQDARDCAQEKTRNVYVGTRIDRDGFVATLNSTLAGLS